MSESPSISPSQSPSTSISPSISPSKSPSLSPSLSPSKSPSFSPSLSPSLSPSYSPSISPSQSPSTSLSPSLSPSKSPSYSPSAEPEDTDEGYLEIGDSYIELEVEVELDVVEETFITYLIIWSVEKAEVAIPTGIIVEESTSSQMILAGEFTEEIISDTTTTVTTESSEGLLLVQGLFTETIIDPSAAAGVSPIVEELTAVGGLMFDAWITGTDVSAGAELEYEVEDALGRLVMYGELTEDIIVADDWEYDAVGSLVMIGEFVERVVEPEVYEFTTYDSLLAITGEFTEVGVPDEVFETWVLNGYTLEPSMYSGFNFNSYAYFNGQYYGCKDDGIYLLEGATDDGAAIHSGVRIGPSTLGTRNRKRIRAVYPGDCGTNAILRVVGGVRNEEAQFPLTNERFSASREVQDSELTVEIKDFGNLDHVEIITLVLAPR